MFRIIDTIDSYVDTNLEILFENLLYILHVLKGFGRK